MSATVGSRPDLSEPPAARRPAHAPNVVRNSVTGSIWTVVSRATGLGQSIAVAAVLGATYLGNTYQGLNAIPNLLYYQLLAGSLFASILVPPLVARSDAGDDAGAQRLARGFYGILLLASAALALVLLVLAPLVLRAFTSTVSDATVMDAQRRVGLVFLVLFVPQIPLYATAGTGAAVMNARGRFALAAGGPALENLAMIATLAAAAVLFGVGTSIVAVTTPELVLLGAGTTAGVAIHAVSQWIGARGSGVALVPTIGWRDPEIRRVLMRIVPTLGFTGLAALQTAVVFVLANGIRGGLVAFQLATSFFFLPVAVAVWPIARSLLPELSRLARRSDGAFGRELSDGTALATFVTAPAAVAYIVLAVPIARAVAFGALEPGGVPLVAASLAALGAGVLAETWFVLGTYAFYAREDVRSPVRSMLVRAGASIVLAGASLWFHGATALLVLGAGLTTGTFLGAAHAWTALRRRFDVRAPIRAALVDAGIAVPMAAAAAGTAWFASRVLPTNDGGDVAVVLVAGSVGIVVYLALQARRHAPEMRRLRAWRGGTLQREAGDGLAS